jgi:hypothetical protein
MKDIHSIWGHRWLTPKAYVAKSRIEGFGIFAKHNIQKGEIVRVAGGVIIPKSDIKKYAKIILDGAEMQVDNNFYLGPVTNDPKERRLLNHSCNPNVGFLDSIRLVAIRNIKVGEELTVEYATCYTHYPSFKCRCGTKSCRKVIKQTDWKNKEIQSKYLKYFTPYLKEKALKQERK